MSTECDIFEGFGAMSLEDTSSSSTRKLKKEDTSLKKKKNKKKEEVVRKLSGGGVKKKKSGLLVERRKARIVDKFNAGLPKGCGRIYYGVDRSVSETMFISEITYPDGRKVCLGTFKTPKLAAIAYDQAAFQIYGLQAHLNFPSHFANNNS